MSSRSRRLLTALAAAAAALIMSISGRGPAIAANPSSGTIGPADPPLNWVGTATGGTPTLGENDCVEGKTCDTFTLTVSGTASDWAGKLVSVKIQWNSPTNDYDLYVHKDSNAAPVVASSADGATTQEDVVIDPGSSGVGLYTVHVVYFAVTPGLDQYRGTASVQAKPPAPPPPTPGAGPAPRYQNYASPPTLGNDSGEPSIGVNWNSGNVMFEAVLETLRVSFDDCSSPAKTTWLDRSAPTSVTTLDPILFCDRETGRTIVSQLAGKSSLMSFSDTDGDNWTPSSGPGVNSGVDHQTVGGGPYRPGSGFPAPGQTYKNAVYYCSQDVADALCSRSDNGGLSFGPAVPIYTAAQCGGLHGHVKVAPDGTVYLPNKRCSGQQGVVVSENNGLTWSVRRVPGSLAGDTDPSVGIASDGTVYFGYDNGDGRPRVAVSHDKGLTWTNDTDVGFGAIVSTVFPAVVAGDPDRAAFAFLGTTTTTNQIWHLYTATTYDGGKSWITINATPGDPVQRGTICTGGISCGSDRNLLDFFDATVDKQGRVLVGYADGCIGGCVNAPPNSFSAKATIARQSGGRRMFAAFDPVEPAVPAAPLVTGTRDAIGVHLSWPEPDNGGSAITGYRIFRRTAATTYSATPFAQTVHTGFDDTTVDPAVTYFYKVSAVNAVGEGPTCSEVQPVAVVQTSPCTLPGVLVSNDTSDTVSPADPRVNIRQLYVAEPFAGPGVNKLVFTLKVGQSSLGTAPPNSQWYIIWNRPTPDASFDRNYVAMKSNALGAVRFEFGKISPPSVNAPTKLGDADGGSYDPAGGTITITVSNSKVDNPIAGQDLTDLHARTFFSRVPDNHPVTALTADDTSPNGIYHLAGNASCKPNEAPTAILNAAPRSGLAPLTVNFDGSGSTDPDGDAIASFTFNFGDGSAPVTQSSPTISHTYAKEGEYRATLTVKDSRGLQSANVAAVVIEVDPAADLAVSQTHSPEPAHVGQLLTYIVTVKNNGPSDATGVTLTDTLPKNAGFGSSTPSQGTCSQKPTRGTITCNLGAIPGGSSATVKVVVKPTAKGTITNTATATATSPVDPNTNNNTSKENTTVQG